MSEPEFGALIREAAPALFAELDPLIEDWLGVLLAKLAAGNIGAFRPKQVNDPIWGTIELMPWEVALLDTPMLQRLRGVRQLGLAHLVFPSASHSRLEHIIGVVGAVEQIAAALTKQIDRWNREHPSHHHLPAIDESDRFTLRLAGIFHDIGHGPFSHASEPILDVDSSLLPITATGWRQDLKILREILKQKYSLHDEPAPSEVLAAAILNSEAVGRVLSNDKLFVKVFGAANDLQERMSLAIIGAIDAPHDRPIPQVHLSAVISSQIDADRIDFLSRDAHHAGLEIGFDTQRMLARLEVLRITEQFLDDSELALREKAATTKDGILYQIGIAASGFGSFEQMLIGRTFLYDRLYHHHKIRAAEAMAQRQMLMLERERGERLSLAEVMLPVSDNTLLHILAGDVEHRQLPIPTTSSNSLAKGILTRTLFHRAFAFRSRFIAAPPGMDPEIVEQNQIRLWTELLKALKPLNSRYSVGAEIYALAVECANILRSKGMLSESCETVADFTPDHIIVDFPSRKAEPIRMLARYPNGQLRVPEFSFNPAKWADAYDLQKRTGYVFAPKPLIPLVTLASKVYFLRAFGIAMAKDADGFIKSGLEVDAGVLEAIRDGGLIDNNLFEHLTNQRHSLVKVRAADLNVPPAWVDITPDLPLQLAVGINNNIQSGLPYPSVKALGRVLKALFAFVDDWHRSGSATADLANEAALQAAVKKALNLQGLKVVESDKVSGGALDLFVDDTVLIENKFEGGAVADPGSIAPNAGAQGRRYTIALDSQLIIVIVGYRPKPGKMRAKADSIEVRRVANEAEGRVQVRIYVPYGSIKPSDEKAA